MLLRHDFFCFIPPKETISLSGESLIILEDISHSVEVIYISNHEIISLSGAALNLLDVTSIRPSNKIYDLSFLG